jgi:hypothetical protein
MAYFLSHLMLCSLYACWCQSSNQINLPQHAVGSVRQGVGKEKDTNDHNITTQTILHDTLSLEGRNNILVQKCVFKQRVC